MNVHSISSNSQEFVAYIGLDWGDKKHAYYLQTQDGSQECGFLKQTPEDLQQWLQELKTTFKGRPIALALEASKGPVVNALKQCTFLTIHPVHPVMSMRMRQAFRPSGAKDDGPDALLLLEILLHHRDKLRPLLWEESSIRRIDGLSRARRRLVNDRTKLICRLTSMLKEYYPQALELAGTSLSSPMALEFLSRWPDLIDLKRAREQTLRQFYYKRNVRRPERVAQRLEQIKNAKALTTDEAIVSVRKMEVASLVDQLKILEKHIKAMDKAIAEEFKSHENAELFRNLPGAGPTMAPRLLALFNDDTGRYDGPESIQKACGVAPVTERSGQRRRVRWRWHASTFQRQTLVEWAGLTVRDCHWAKQFYERQISRGKKRQTILRALAFKWVRIIWQCLQRGEYYDEQRYLEQLARKNSPYARAA